MGEYFRERQSIGEDFRAALFFWDFCQLKQNDKGKGTGGLGMENSKLQRTI